MSEAPKRGPGRPPADVKVKCIVDNVHIAAEDTVEGRSGDPAVKEGAKRLVLRGAQRDPDNRKKIIKPADVAVLPPDIAKKLIDVEFVAKA
jgi:hypothetical protein